MTFSPAGRTLPWLGWSVCRYHPPPVSAAGTAMTDRDDIDPAAADWDDRLRLRLALDAAYLISFEWDIRRDEVRRLFSGEPEFAATTHSAPDTLESVRQRVHPADREAFTKAIDAALADPEGRYASEFRIRRSDGTIVWLSESGIVQRDAEGAPLRLIGLSQDVTASKEAALKLAESESLLRAVFDSAPLMMGLVELADDDQIIPVFASPATAAFVNEPADIAGRSTDSLGISAGAARYWVDHYRQSQRVGGPVHFEYPHPHGKEVVWLSCFVVHLGPTASGRPRFSYVATDVTERKKAEEQVAAQARLLDLSGDAILVRDAEDRVAFWSQGAERLYGYTRDEALGREPHELLKTEFPEPLASIRRSLERDGQWQGELLHRTKAGAQVTTLSRWVLDARRGRGRPSVLESNTDITLRKEWEAQLLESDRRKDEHLAMLAHELRNPLAPVRTAGALVRAQAGGNTVLQRCAAIIERQTKHMARLLDDLLDVMRTSRGSLSLQREHVGLRDVIEAAVESVRPLIDEGGHQLELHLPAEEVVLDADPVRLAQVFGNLLSNAAKYSDSPGHIAITASVEGGEVSVRVSDEGCGIPEQMT
jgi:PAS domain S-box-containing protein